MHSLSDQSEALHSRGAARSWTLNPKRPATRAIEGLDYITVPRKD